MKILSISGILPIPELISSNDFVFQTHKTHRSCFPQDEIVIIRPTQYKTNIKKILTRTTDFDRLGSNLLMHIEGFPVHIYPFFSSRRARDIHSLLTRSVYGLNKKRIKQLIEEYRPDVVHAQYIFPDGLLAAWIKRKYGIPYVITTHNELFYFNWPVSNRIAAGILRSASAILPINYRNFNYFKAKGFHQTGILPLGFHKSFLRPQKQSVPGPVKIVTVAELIKLKNIDKVIRAMALMNSNHECTYTIIGKGRERKNLQLLVEKYNLEEKVSFIDYVPHKDLADELYKHDILIMPSYIETFGRVYFEAMAMGIPIICAKNSGIYGYFKEGEEAFSVNHKKVKDIAHLLDSLVTHHNERVNVGLQGQKLVSGFTWDDIVRKLRIIYDQAIGSK